MRAENRTLTERYVIRKLNSWALAITFVVIVQIPISTNAEWFSCQPTEVLEYSNFIRVRCSSKFTLDDSKFRYLGVAIDDAPRAERFQHYAVTALSCGQLLRVLVTNEDINASPCRYEQCAVPRVFGIMAH